MYCNYSGTSLYEVNTTGTQLAVLFREVSLIQRLICTQIYCMWLGLQTLLIREVSFFIVSFMESFHCMSIPSHSGICKVHCIV